MKPAPLVQRVSTLELFFDLVFVFTITQLTSVLRAEPTLMVGLQVLLMLAIIFWMYGGYVWLTNAVSAEHASRRLVLLAGMAGFFIVALTVPDAFDGGGLAFGLAYAVVIAVHIGLFSRASRVRSLLGVLRVGRFNVLIAVAVVVGGAFGGPVQLVVWSLVVLLAWLVVARLTPGSFDIGAAHFVERHGLVVIVAIGESVVALGLGLGDLPLGPGLIAVALLGLALSACLWWTYFGGDDERAERSLLAASPERRSIMAIQSYGYAHLALLLGIVSIAAAVEEAAHHPTDALGIGLAVALGGGGAPVSQRAGRLPRVPGDRYSGAKIARRGALPGNRPVGIVGGRGRPARRSVGGLPGPVRGRVAQSPVPGPALVARRSQLLGYRWRSLTRASSVVNCQST